MEDVVGGGESDSGIPLSLSSVEPDVLIFLFGCNWRDSLVGIIGVGVRVRAARITG